MSVNAKSKSLRRRRAEELAKVICYTIDRFCCHAACATESAPRSARIRCDETGQVAPGAALYSSSTVCRLGDCARPDGSLGELLPKPDSPLHWHIFSALGCQMISVSITELLRSNAQAGPPSLSKLARALTPSACNDDVWMCIRFQFRK